MNKLRDTVPLKEIVAWRKSCIFVIMGCFSKLRKTVLFLLVVYFSYITSILRC